MDLARVWTRQLYGASGAALFVPTAIAGALVLLALGGGFAKLGTLGQTFSGPAVPAFSHAHSSALSAGPGSPLAHALVAAGLATTGSGAATTSSGTGRVGPAGSVAPGQRGGRGLGGSTGARTPGSNGTGAPGAGPGGGGPGGGGPGGAGGTGGTPPPAPPPKPPTLIDGVVAIGTSVTQQVPGPVGQLATQTLQSVGGTLDGIVPTAAARSAPGGSSAGASGLVGNVVSGLRSR